MSQSRELTAEESALLTAAITEAVVQGNHEAAKHIADLAKDPDRIKEILADQNDAVHES